jgi:hypothetical protein
MSKEFIGKIKGELSKIRRARRLERKRKSLYEERQQADKLYAELLVLYTQLPDSDSNSKTEASSLTMVTKETFGLEKIRNNHLGLNGKVAKIELSISTPESKCLLSIRAKEKEVNYLLDRSGVSVILGDGETFQESNFDELEDVVGIARKLLSRASPS